MKLRFKIDQAAAFRRGEDAPRSIATLDVDPAALDQAQRDLIAERLFDGINVCRGARDATGKVIPCYAVFPDVDRTDPDFIIAASGTLEALLEAVVLDDASTSLDVGVRADGAINRLFTLLRDGVKDAKALLSKRDALPSSEASKFMEQFTPTQRMFLERMASLDPGDTSAVLDAVTDFEIITKSANN